MFTLQSFAEDILAADITDSATSMTLTTGNFGTPTGEQMLVIDPDVTSKREIIKCAIDGTAVTSIDRAQDGTSAVAHTSGAKIIMAWTKSHHDELKTYISNLTLGWIDPDETWTYASASSITVPSGAASTYAVGDKLRLKQGGSYKYFYVVGVADTVLTVTGGTDYTVANSAITDNYYSKAASPVGFPNHSTKVLGYVSTESDFTIQSTEQDITSMTKTVTVPPLLGKKVKISFGMELQNNDSSTSDAVIKIKEGSTTIRVCEQFVTRQGKHISFFGSEIITPTAGSHTYKLSAQRAGGADTLYINASSDQKTFMLIELI